MYSFVRVPIQPSLILARAHITAHVCLLLTYLTLPTSSWLYLPPLLFLQLLSYRKLRCGGYFFQKQRNLQIVNQSATLSLDGGKAKDIYDLKAHSLWSALLVVQFYDDQMKRRFMWIHASETDLEAFRRLKVLMVTGQLNQRIKEI